MKKSSLRSHRSPAGILPDRRRHVWQLMSYVLVGLVVSVSSAHGNDKTATIKPVRYDFGSASVSAAKDYVRIGIDKVYTKERGYGLVPSSTDKDRGTRHRKIATDRRLDTFVFDDGGTQFLQDLPNGTYYVSLATGDAAYPSETAVTLNGVSLQLTTRTQRGQFVRINGAKVRVTNGKLRVEIGGWGQLCYLDIIPANSPSAVGLRNSEKTRQLVTKLQAAPIPPRKTDADNQGTWLCIGPWHFPESGIWIYPTFPADLKAGRNEIRHGWGLYLHLPDKNSPAPEGYSARVNLTEETGRESSPARKRTLVKNRKIDLIFRRVFLTRPDHHHAFEALIPLIEPFQARLKRSPDVTYSLSVDVVDGKGQLIKSHAIRFANRPTYLLSSIDLPQRGLDVGPLGTRAKVNIGDLTGNGECDFLFCISAGYKVAYDASGRVLWEYQQPREPWVYNSVSTRVFDIDGDGAAEVICLQEGQLRILDGRNGKVRRSTRWPGVTRRTTSIEARIFLANLRGTGVRDIVILTGTGNHPSVSISAFTGDLKHLWNARGFFEDGGVGSHCLNVADIDNDGKDEIAFGTTMLDHDGKVLWRLPYTPLFNRGGGDSDHVDEAELGDLDGDGRLEIFYASGTLLDARSGKPHLTRLPAVTNGQWVRIESVRTDLPGKQLLIANKWAAPRLFNMDGQQLDWPFPFASWDLLDWDGDGKTEIMGGGLICDRRGVVVGVCDPHWTMPQYGDISGNGREEAIPWCLDVHGQQIRVFSSAPRPRQRRSPLAIRRRHYNFRD